MPDPLERKPRADRKVNWRWIVRLLAAVFSGSLLAVAYPPLEWHGVAWFALVPWIVALRGTTKRQAATLGFVAGVVFWGFSLHWLTCVTTAGWIGLALYCALYFVPFSVVLSQWLHRHGVETISGNLGGICLGVLTWVGWEYLRSVLFTGFAWNPLAVSQYTTLAMIQAARWGGVGLVSALVVLMNLAIGFTAMRYIASRGRHRGRWHPELALALVCCALAHTDGYRYLMRMPPSDTAVRAALVQPNISQFEKWTPEFIDKIYSRLGDLTASALHAGPSDLVVWPETALPDDVRISPYSYDFVYSLATQGVPVLVGSMDTVWNDDGEPVYYNTSFLFGKNGHIVERYDKQHLVIFGEYVPFGEVFTFMKALTPIAESFSGGTESTLFELENVPAPFSVLICFEDTIATLARRAVQCGARLLINQTNDAWFDGSSGARQHLAHCVFRAVENDVPIIRVANSGVSCRIDPRGRILDVIDDGQGNTQVAGFRMTRAPIYPDGTPTFYNQHGEWFAIGCTIIGVLALLVTIRPPQKLPS